jgi:hypothetical protein
MNALGKTLVILNFLFAVIVGFLLVFDIALRNKWKDAYDSVIQQTRVVGDSRESTKTALAKILEDYKDKQADVEKLTQKLADEEATRKIKEGEFEVAIAKMTNELRDKDLIVNETKDALKRKVEEIALLTANIKTREESIVKLEQTNNKLRIDAVQYEAMFRAGKIQNENLLAQVQELTRALAQKDAGVASADQMFIRNPNEPNPPSALVNGKIERVDAELVQLSVGTDHGVNKNNTLDVYRLQPEAKYLGMVRIVEADHHRSVGRLIPSGNAQFRTPLRPGDLVTSKLTK